MVVGVLFHYNWLIQFEKDHLKAEDWTQGGTRQLEAGISHKNFLSLNSIFNFSNFRFNILNSIFILFFVFRSKHLILFFFRNASFLGQDSAWDFTEQYILQVQSLRIWPYFPFTILFHYLLGIGYFWCFQRQHQILATLPGTGNVLILFFVSYDQICSRNSCVWFRDWKDCNRKETKLKKKQSTMVRTQSNPPPEIKIDDEAESRVKENPTQTFEG